MIYNQINGSVLCLQVVLYQGMKDQWRSADIQGNLCFCPVWSNVAAVLNQIQSSYGNYQTIEK